MGKDYSYKLGRLLFYTGQVAIRIENSQILEVLYFLANNMNNISEDYIYANRKFIDNLSACISRIELKHWDENIASRSFSLFEHYRKDE